MRDTILTAVLTFGVLAAGTAAIGTELLRVRTLPAALPVITLPAVTVVGPRVAPAASTQYAVESAESPARRVQ